MLPVGIPLKQRRDTRQEWSSGPARWAKECWGLDLQGASTAVVRVLKGRNSPQFLSATLPVPANTVTAMSLSCAESAVRTLEAPFPSSRRAARVLPTLLDIQLPFALEECVVRFMNLRPVAGGKMRALAVVARRADVARRLGQWAAAGIDPVVVDHEGLALWTQSIAELPPNKGFSGLRVVVYAGSDRCAVVAGRGQEFLGAHAVSASDPGTDIRRLLRTYCDPSGDSIMWVLAGPGAETQQYSRLPADLGDVAPGTTHTVGNPAEFLARSVAVRALTDGALRCNFREADMAHPITLKRGERRARMATAMFFLAAVVLWGTAMACRLAPRAEEARINRNMQQLLDNIAGYPVAARGEHGIRVAREAFTARMNDMQSFLAPFEDSQAKLLCEMVESAASNEVFIDTLALASARVDMTGASVTWNPAGTMARWLEQRGYKVTLERMEAGADERIPFTLKAVRGGAK